MRRNYIPQSTDGISAVTPDRITMSSRKHHRLNLNTLLCRMVTVHHTGEQRAGNLIADGTGSPNLISGNTLNGVVFFDGLRSQRHRRTAFGITAVSDRARNSGNENQPPPIDVCGFDITA